MKQIKQKKCGKLTRRVSFEKENKHLFRVYLFTQIDIYIIVL